MDTQQCVPPVAPCRYLAGLQLLQHWMQHRQEAYWQALRQLLVRAQQQNDGSLLDNPYLQITAVMAVMAPNGSSSYSYPQ